MRRKEFLKAVAAFTAICCAAPFSSLAKQITRVRRNWGRNYTYKAANLQEPSTKNETAKLVSKTEKFKALGTKHCFNDIADSTDNQLSTKMLNRVLEIDDRARTAIVESGIRYGDFTPTLHERGLALHNLASLPHISIGGACATATHGSGDKNQILAGSVIAMDLLTASGEIITIDKNHPDFYGAVVNLGALGIVINYTLQLQESFAIRNDIFDNLPLVELEQNFNDIMASGYSVSLFTDWQNKVVRQVWIKRRTDEQLKNFGDRFYGAVPAPRNIISSVDGTDAKDINGPWFDRLPHFKMRTPMSTGNEIQSEYFVSRDDAVEAILELEKLSDIISPQLMMSEIRSIAADEYWLSPCYKKDRIAIHFTWQQRAPEVREILKHVEAALAPFNALPHWGKLYTTSPEILHANYPKMQDFIDLCKKYDPTGKFKNKYLDLNIFRSQL